MNKERQRLKKNKKKNKQNGNGSIFKNNIIQNLISYGVEIQFNHCNYKSLFTAHNHTPRSIHASTFYSPNSRPHFFFFCGGDFHFDRCSSDSPKSGVLYACVCFLS